MANDVRCLLPVFVRARALYVEVFCSSLNTILCHKLNLMKFSSAAIVVVGVVVVFRVIL